MTGRSEFGHYVITWPHGTSVQSVAAVMAAVAARTRPTGLFGLPVVGFEVVGSADGIQHLLLVREPEAEFVLGQLRTQVPGVRVVPLSSDSSLPAVRSAVHIATELRVSQHERPLRTAPEETATAILATLGPLERGEVVRLQWLFAPRVRPKPSAVSSELTAEQFVPDRELLSDLERVRARDRKLLQPLLVGAARVSVQAGSPEAARRLIRNTLSAVRTAEAPGVKLVNRLLPGKTVLRRMNEVVIPFSEWGLTLNAYEAAGLIAVPFGELVVPGLETGASRQLPAPSVTTLPRPDVTVLGVSTYPGSAVAVGIPEEDRLQHCWIMGPTGVGKSTLMAAMVEQDVLRGRGLVLLDPKGDLVELVLSRVPSDRQRDVIVLDPTDATRPVGFNPLKVGSSERHVVDRVVDFVVGTFHSLYEATWGPRSEDILRAGCLSLILAGDPSKPYTLCDLSELLLGGVSFRRSIIERLDDPELANFWSWFGKLKTNDRQIVLGPVANKLRAFTLRSAIRNIIGRSNGIDLADVVRSGKLLLVPLPKGVIGQETTDLIGSLLVTALWQVILERAAVPAEERSPFFLYLDEVQEFLRLPGDIGDVLTTARSLRAGMVLAHQHTGQLPKELLAAVQNNARSKVFFQLAQPDAKAVAPMLEPWLTAQDLQYLPVREAVVVPTIDSRVQPPATVKTRPVERGTVDTSALRRRSAEQWGADVAAPTVTGDADEHEGPGPKRRKSPLRAPLSGSDEP